ncbi:MAG: hypothetical protein HY537_01465 [Deltaproteobacteria bacterium]|nr:hypothetical protein [Deltaproteobacteria bacterium]
MAMREHYCHRIFHVSLIVWLFSQTCTGLPDSVYVCDRAFRYFVKAGKATSGHLKNYAAELKEHPWRRPFLKKDKSDEPPPRIFEPTATNPHRLYVRPFIDPIDTFSQLIPRMLSRIFLGKSWDIHFFRWSKYHLITVPTGKYTSHIYGEPLRWTIPVYFVGSAVSGVLGWTAYETGVEMAIQRKLRNEYVAHAGDWDTIIEFDVRYKDIKDALALGLIDKDAARIRAMQLKEVLNAYYQFVSEQPDHPAEDFLDGTYFAHINKWVENGIPPKNGYRYSSHFTPRLSKAQISELVAATHSMLASKEIIFQWLLDKRSLQQLKRKNKALSDWVTKFENEDFTKRVMRLQETGGISVHESLNLLQLNAEWERIFAEWKILGVEKLKKKDGQYLPIALTPKDIQDELLMRHPSPEQSLATTGK